MTNSLERAFDLLELLAERGEARLGELIEELGSSKATVFRLLVSLQERGYVEHDREQRVYRLGPAISSLTSQSSASSLVQVAAPAMAEIRAVTGETVNLAVLRRGHVVWAACIDGAHAIRISVRVGGEVPVHSTAAGKAILSTMPMDEWGALIGPEPFHSFTSKTATTFKNLQREVEKVSKRGYAIDDGEAEVGGVCLAAPIVGRDGRPVGAISVSGTDARFGNTARLTASKIVSSWCQRISAEFASAGENRERNSSRNEDGTVTRLNHKVRHDGGRR